MHGQWGSRKLKAVFTQSPQEYRYKRQHNVRDINNASLHLRVKFIPNSVSNIFSPLMNQVLTHPRNIHLRIQFLLVGMAPISTITTRYSQIDYFQFFGSVHLRIKNSIFQLLCFLYIFLIIYVLTINVPLFKKMRVIMVFLRD